MIHTSHLKYTLYILFFMIAGPLYVTNISHKFASGIKKESFDSTINEWSSIFAHVVHLVKDKHYKATNPEKSMIKAIDAFLNCTDPHSNFLHADAYKSMIDTTKGSFPGIGVSIDNTRKTKDKFLTIVDIIPDGPAEKAGVKQYDKIIEIDRKSLEGVATENAIALLKGPQNSSVSIKVIREGHHDLLSFTIQRNIITDQSALSFYIKNYDIYYIGLSLFTQNALAEITKVLAKAQKHAYKGIILDLRNNSGGLLSAAIDIAGLFLDKNSTIVCTKNKYDHIITQYTTKHAPIANNSVPIFILINNYTASAAEILAGSLKIHADDNNQRNPLLVFLVGTPTFGKGSVQEIIPVGKNSAVKLTTALYFLPHNTPVQAVGITPDFVIERSLPATQEMVWFTQYYGRESNLENHIITSSTPTISVQKPLTILPTPVKGVRERAKKMLETDNQLREAINLSLLLHNAGKERPTLLQNRTTALNYLKSHHIGHDEYDIQEIA